MTTAVAGYWCPVPSGRFPLRATASDLMLFLWHRVSADSAAGAGRFTVRGDASLLDRYFVLAPPV